MLEKFLEGTNTNPDLVSDNKKIPVDPLQELLGSYNIGREEGSIAEILGDSSYLEGFLPGGDARLFKATHQPASHQAGNAIIGGIGSGLLTAIEDAGYILDLENNINRLRGIEEVEINWLSKIAKDAKEGLTQDILPIHRRGSDIIDWSDSGFYWESLRSLLDSALGFGVVGLGTFSAVKAAKVGAGFTKLANIGARGVATATNIAKFGFKKGSKALRAARTEKYLENIAPFVDDLAGKGQQLSAAYITNFGEGKMMALEMYEKTFEEIKQAKPNMPESEIRKIAGDRADQFILANKLFIATDAFALAGLSRGVNSTRNKVRDLSWKSFSKSFSKASTRNPLVQAGAESFEEIGQNVAQMEASYRAKLDAGLTEEGVPTNLEQRLFKFATSDQALLEGAMGFFGGPIQYGIIQGPQDFANRKDIHRRYNEQIKQIEDNKSFLNEKLKGYIDTHKAVNEAEQDGQQFIAEELKGDLFLDIAYDNFERGTTDQLERSLIDLRDDEATAKANNLGDDYKEDVNQQIAKLQDLEADYIRMKRRYSNPVFQPHHRNIFKLSKLQKTTQTRLDGVNGKYNDLKQTITKSINEQSGELVNQVAIDVPLLRMERDSLVDLRQKSEKLKEEINVRNAILKRSLERGIDPGTLQHTPTNKISRIINKTNDQIDKLTGRIEKELETLKTLEVSIPVEEVEKYTDNTELKDFQIEKSLLTNYVDEINQELSTITNEESARELLEKVSDDVKKAVLRKAEQEKTIQDQSDAETDVARSNQKKANEESADGVVEDVRTEKEVKNDEEKLNLNTPENTTGLGNDIKSTDPKRKVEKEKEKKNSPTSEPTIESSKNSSPINQDGGESTPIEHITTTTSQRQAQEDFNDLMHNLVIEANDLSVANEETEEIRDDDIGKINYSNNALAYLSRDFIKYLELGDGRLVAQLRDAADKLSGDLRDPKLLSPNQYLPGTKLTLFLDKDYKVGEQTYDTLLQKGRDTQELAGRKPDEESYDNLSYDFIPIGIRNSEGKLVGYLHDTNFPDKRTKSSNVEEDVKVLRAIRNALITEHNGTYETTVMEKRLGYLATAKDGKILSLGEAMKDPNLILGTVTSNGIQTNKPLTDKVVTQDLRPGYPYAFIKKTKDTSIAIPLLSTRLSKEHRLSLLSATRMFLERDTTSPQSKEMFDAGFGLHTLNGYKKYVRGFMGVAELDKGVTLKEVILNDKSTNAYITIESTGIDASLGQGEGYITTFENKNGERLYIAGLGKDNRIVIDQRIAEFQQEEGREPTGEELEQIKNQVNQETGEGVSRKAINREDFLQRLDRILSKSYYHINAEKLSSNDLNLPIIDGDNVVTNETKSYTQFIKETHETNVIDFDLGDGEFTSFVQPIIRFGTPSLSKVDEIKGTSDTTIITEEKKEIEQVTSPNTLLTLDLSQVDDDIFAAIAPEESKLQVSLMRHRLTDVSGKAMAGREQDELLASFTSSVFNDLVETKKKISISDSFNKIKNDLDTFVKSSIQKSNLSDIAKEGYTKRIDNLLGQWDKVEELLLRRVQAIQGVRAYIKLDSNEEEAGASSNTLDDAPFDLEGYNEKVDYDRSSLELDPKDTISVRLKRFLAGIPDIDIKTKRSLVNTYIPYLKLVPYDVAFAELSGVLVDTKPNFNVMVKKLENFVETKPYIRNVINKLNESDTQVQQEFASEMRKHQALMKTVLIEFDDDLGQHSVKIIDTNRSSFAQTIADDWESNLNSKADNYKDGSPYFTKGEIDIILNEYKKVKELVNSYIEEENEDKKFDLFEDSVAALDKWLNRMGIQMSDNALGDIISDQWEFYTRESKGSFDILSKNFASRKDKEPTVEANNYFQDKAVKTLARLESQHRTDIFAQSFRNGENKTIYNYSYNKLFIDRFLSLTEDKAKLNILSNNSFNKHSFWLNELMDDNSDFKDVFKYFYFDSLRVERKTGKIGENLSDAELEIAEFSLFANKGNHRYRDNKKRIVNLLHPPMGEKKNRVGATVIGVNTRLSPTEDTIANDTADTLFREIILPELQRIKDFEKKKVDAVGFNQGAKRFLMTPGLNTESVPDHLKGIWYKNGTKLKTLKTLEEEGYFEKLRDYIRGEVDRLVQEKLDDWINYGIISKKEEGTTLKYIDKDYIENIVHGETKKDNWSVAKFAAYDFVVNTMIGNANFQKLFIGDPAYFFNIDKPTSLATFNNQGKRLGSYNGPGRAVASDDIYVQAIMNDRSAASLNKALHKIPQYAEIKETTDAQEYTTLEEYLLVLERTGRISPQEASEYLVKDKGRKLSSAIISKLMGLTTDDPILPSKPLYTGFVQDEEFPTERPVVLKTASIPLFRTLTKGFEIDKLRQAMEVQKVSRLVFESGVKVGDKIRVEDNQLFNSDGTIIDDIKFTPKNTLRLDRSGFRIQQDTVFDPNKTTSNDGSQQRKFPFLDLLHLPKMKERLERYNKAYGELFEIKANKFNNKYIITDEEGGKTFDLSSVRKDLLDEAKKRSYSINDLDIISMSDEDFLKYIVFSESSTRIESLLNSLTDNNVRKNKMPGLSAALVSEEGWRFSEDEIKDIDDFDFKKSNVTFTKNWTGELRPQEVVKGKVKPAQILVKWNFIDEDGKLLNMKDYLGDDGRIDSAKFPPELMRLAGYRIPTSKQSSMSYMEVVGFLPEGISESVIATRDLITQMGLDFDYDKLYLHQFHLKKPITDDVEAITKYTGEDRIKELQNEIIAIQHEVFSDPKAQEVIQEPIGYGKLRELAERVDVATLKSTKGGFNPLSQAWLREKYLNARQAKQGVGVFSLLTTLIATSQTLGVPVYFTRKVGRTVKEASFKFGNQSSTSISKPSGKNKVPKSRTASAFQNVVLDNENLQIGDKLNINNETFGVINTLIVSGFDEHTIIPFITQPIITDFIKEVARQKGSLENLESTPENEAYERVLKRWESESYEELTDADKKDLADNLNGEELFDILSNSRPDVVTQRALLDKFVDIKTFGNELRRLTTAINTDSKGIPKFFTTSLLKEQDVKTLDSINIFNSEKFIGEIQRDSFGIIQDVIPETINGFTAVHALFTNNQLWSNVLPYNSNTVKGIYDRLEQLTGMGGKEHEVRGAWRFNVFKDLITSIQSTDVTKETRERLFLDTEDNKSLAVIAQEIKESGRLSDNAFINILSPRVDKRTGRVSTVIINNSTASRTLDENVHAAFAELLEDDSILFGNYKVSDFAKDLAIYGMIAGNHVASTFRKYIPIVYQREVLDDVVSKINWNDTSTINVNNFITQQVQHNPYTVQAITPNDFLTVKGKNLTNSTHITLENKGNEDYRNIVGADVEYLEYLSYRGKKGYHLYKLTSNRSEDGSPIYAKIPVLGTFGMDEYNPNESLLNSIIADRNENTTVLRQDFIPSELTGVEPEKSFINDAVDNVTVTNPSPINEATSTLGNVAKTGDILNKIIRDKDAYPYFGFLANTFKDFKFEVPVIGGISKISELPITFATNEEMFARFGDKFKSVFGVYDEATQGIYLNKERLEKENKEFIYKIVLHEVVHALTVIAIKTNPELKASLEATLNLAKEVLRKAGHERLLGKIGKLGAFELAAEILTDELTQNELSKVIVPKELQEEKKYKNLLHYLYDKFSTAIAEFLGIKNVPENSLLKRALEDTMTAINAQQDSIGRNEINGREDVYAFAASAEPNNRFDVIVQDRKIRIKDLEKSITKIKDTPGSVRRVEELRERAKEYRSDIEETSKIEALEDLDNLANKDIEILKGILSQSKVEEGDYYEAERIINLWKRSIDLLFENEQKEFRSKLIEQFENYKNEVEYLEVKLEPIRNGFVEEFLRGEGVETPIATILAKTKEVSGATAKHLSIGRFGDELLDVISKTILDTNVDHARNIKEFDNRSEGIINAAIKELNSLGYKGNKLWDLYAQESNNGQRTHRVVVKFNDSFFKARRSLWYKTEASKRKSEYYKFVKDSTIIFDFRKLFRQEDNFEGEDLKFNKTKTTFDKGSPDIEENKNQIISVIGEKEFDRLLKREEKHLQDYKDRYENAKIVIWEDIKNQKEREAKLNEWVETESPYWYSETIARGKRITKFDNVAERLVYSVPKTKQWLDKKFEIIKDNKALMDFYELYIDTMNDHINQLPDHAREHASINSVAYFKRSVGQLFTGEKGMVAGINGIIDSAKKSISSPINNASFISTDPVTEKENLGITAKLPSLYEEVKKLVDIQKVKFELEFGKEPDRNEVQKMRNDAYDLVSRDSNFDLAQSLKLIYLTTSNYTHRARIEGQVKLAASVFENAKEQNISIDGKPVRTKNSRGEYVIQEKSPEESFKHLKGALDSTIRDFFGLKPEEAGDIKKILTSEDKKEKEEIEKLLSESEKAFEDKKIEEKRYLEIKTSLEERLEKIGRVVKATSLIKRMMAWIQLKGMGWNIFSGFNNLGFGTIANFVEASDGRVYNMTDIKRGYALTLHSFLRNTSLNAVTTPTAKKIRALVERYNLEDIIIDFMKRKRGKGLGFFKRFAPFQIQKHTEYLNYAPVMIAILNHNTDKNGNFWDQFNTEGKWTGEGKEPDMTALISGMVNRNHGNYNPNLHTQVDDTLFGKMYSQFRRWGFEAVATRFEKEKPDHVLGHRRAGRFRSGVFVFNWAKTKEGEELNLFQKNLFTLQQLGRKLLWKPTKFDERFSEADAANLRKNLTESLIFMSIFMFIAMMKNLAEDEEDKDKKAHLFRLINTFNRIQMDMSFYVNPMEAEQLMRRPIPIATLIVDIGQWTAAFWRFTYGDDIIDSGVNADDSRLLRETSQFFPGSSKLYAAYSAGKTIY